MIKSSKTMIQPIQTLNTKPETSTMSDSEFSDENRAMSDSELYMLCKKYGLRALEARRKFAGLLPEVHRREQNLRQQSSGKSWLEKRGYTCIYEFAARLAGMSREQVNLVLRLEKKFTEMPVLHGALVNGEISANKLAKIASIANSDNQTELSEMAKLLSTRALETLVQEQKMFSDSVSRSDDLTSKCGSSVNKDGLFECNSSIPDVHVNSKTQQTTPEVNLLDHLSSKLQKDLLARLKKGIDINSLLLELLKKHDQYIAEEKECIAAEMEGGSLAKLHNKAVQTSRHVPARVRRVIKLEYGNKCAVPHCDKKAVTLHHTTRFSLIKKHNPFYIAPLCAEHHNLAHLMDANYAGMRGG